VLASSSGSELSQESEQLRSSYFTHHLLVGLRGAGDADHDGQVSIDEAYRYAYHQTLLATGRDRRRRPARQLEVDLRATATSRCRTARGDRGDRAARPLEGQTSSRTSARTP